MNERYIEVLQQYELEVLSVRRGRGAWICETDKGIKLLKEYQGTVKRLEFEYHVFEQIREANYPYVDQYIRNSQDELVSIAGDGSRYILKDWFDNRECNLKDNKEILQAVSGIANLHRLFRQIKFLEEWEMGSIAVKPLTQEMERHNKELRRARNYIHNKRKKSEFELCVIDNYNQFYTQAVEAKEGMELLNHEILTRQSYLCHGSLDQHHILMGTDYLVFIEFNRMHLGAQMEDLYYFMRKVMEKHNWNQQLGMAMLDMYQQVLPMTQHEMECLYYLFLYPEKYWKQINFYYNANKAWIPARNVEKLRKLEEQMQHRHEFLEKIKS